MDDETTLEPRKRPSQARSRALVDALVEATARILASEGPDGVTTNRVAEVAGVSIGSLYQYYPNKSSLIAAVIERELENDMERAAEMLASAHDKTLAQLFELLVMSFVASMEGRRELHEELLPLVDELRRAELVERRRQELTTTVFRLIDARQGELASRLRDGAHADERRETAAFVAIRAVELAFNAAKMERPDLLERPAFADNLARILSTLLLEE